MSAFKKSKKGRSPLLNSVRNLVDGLSLYYVIKVTVTKVLFERTES
jgi:hypothetical protein